MKHWQVSQGSNNSSVQVSLLDTVTIINIRTNRDSEIPEML
jgi:hypothetical protein